MIAGPYDMIAANYWLLADASALQEVIVSMVVGVVPPILINIINRTSEKSGKSEPAAKAQADEGGSLMLRLRNMALFAEQRLLLAIGLLLMAISMVIYISFFGQRLGWGEEGTFTASLVVAIVAGGFAWWAWKSGTLVLMVAYFCSLGLGLTVINFLDGKAPSPMNPAITMVLYLFVVGAVVYYVGYPFRKGVSKWLVDRYPKWALSIAVLSWLMIIGIPSAYIAAYGSRLAETYRANPFAEEALPAREDGHLDASKSLITEMSTGDWLSRDVDFLFRMGSELQLAEWYRESFLGPNPEASLAPDSKDSPDSINEPLSLSGAMLGAQMAAVTDQGNDPNQNGDDDGPGNADTSPHLGRSGGIDDDMGSSVDHEEAKARQRTDTREKMLENEKKLHLYGVYPSSDTAKGFLRPVHLVLYPPVMSRDSARQPLANQWRDFIIYRSLMVHPVNLKNVVPSNQQGSTNRVVGRGGEAGDKELKNRSDAKSRLRMERFTVWGRYKQYIDEWKKIEAARFYSGSNAIVSPYGRGKKAEFEQLLTDRGLDGIRFRPPGEDVESVPVLMEAAGGRLGAAFARPVVDTCRDAILFPGNLEMAHAYAAYVNAHIDVLPAPAVNLILDFHKLPAETQQLVIREVFRNPKGNDEEEHANFPFKLSLLATPGGADINSTVVSSYGPFAGLQSHEKEILVLPESTGFFKKLLDFKNHQGGDQEYKNIIKILEDPVREYWLKRLLPKYSNDHDKTPAGLDKVFNRMVSLDPEVRDHFLGEIGLRHLYANPSPEKVPQWTFFFTRFYVETPFLGAMWYFLASLALLALLVLAGSESKRLILSRERILTRLKIAIADHERQLKSRIDEPAESAPFVGRQDMRQWLVSIAQRGFGTVAVVGRRGVGKTRILREMLAEAVNPDLRKSSESENSGPVQSKDEPQGTTPEVDVPRKSAIGVWMQVPAVQSETDFVTALHRRLADNVESWIANRLKTLPVEARELLDDLKSWEIWMAAAIVVIFLYSIMTSSDAYVQYALIGPMIFVGLAVGMIIYSVIQIPPVNLYGWIFRRENGPDAEDGMGAALLYKEAIRYSGRSSRWRMPTSERNSFFGPRWLAAFFVLLCLFLVITTVDLLFGLMTDEETPLQYLKTVTNAAWWIAVAYVTWRFIVRLRQKPIFQSESGTGGLSLPEAVAQYREFAESVVSKLRHLNANQEEYQRVVICLDELDKIAEPDQMRLFLRKIKGVFEIRGVYYFLSLAEDARRRLALGGSMGKDEVDSAVDHIVVIKPMGSQESRDVLKEYRSRTAPDEKAPLGEPLETFIVISSAGVPRDLLRMVDRVETDRKVMEQDEPQKDPSSAELDPITFIERAIDTETELFLQDELLELAGEFLGGRFAYTSGVTPEVPRARQLSELINSQIRNDLNPGDSGPLRALFRLFLLNLVRESWIDGEKRFVWADPGSFESRAIAFSYNIPTQALPFLVQEYGEIAKGSGISGLAGYVPSGDDG